MIWYVRVALLSAKVQLEELFMSPLIFVSVLLQPFFIAVVAIHMLRHRPDFEGMYVIVGVGLTGLFSVILFMGTSAIARERGLGTLEFLQASPAPLMVILGGKMLGNIALSLVAMIFSYPIVAWVFGFPAVVHQPIAFAISLLLALFSLWSMGMLFAPVSIVWPPIYGFLQGMEYPIFILCGFLFPVLLLPSWLRPMSYVLPPFWAARALHGASLGNLQRGEIVQAWLLLFITSIIMLGLAGLFFRLFLTQARRQGTLGFI